MPVCVCSARVAETKRLVSGGRMRMGERLERVRRFMAVVIGGRERPTSASVCDFSSIGRARTLDGFSGRGRFARAREREREREREPVIERSSIISTLISW